MEQNLKQNHRNIPLFDIVLMILVITYMNMKITKSLGAKTSYSMKWSCIRITCKKRNKKMKTKNTQCLMRSEKK